MGSTKKDLLFAVKNGFLHIFSSTVIDSIIGFISNVAIIRLVSKEHYGQLAYADNILAIFMLFNGLGVTSGLLQYASRAEKKAERHKLLELSFLYGESFNLLLSLLAFIASSVIVFPVALSEGFLHKLAFLPLFSLFFSILSSYFRATLCNKVYSILCITHSVLSFAFSVMGAYLFDAVGIVIARYVSYFIVDLMGLVFLLSEKNRLEGKSLKDSECPKKDFLHYSFVCMLSNSASGILYLLDTFLIGVLVRSDSVVAAYKIATGIPFALNLIPSAVMTFVYPYFVHIKDDRTAVRKQYYKLVFYLGSVNGLLSLVMFVMAPNVIKILYGVNYMESVLPLRILIIGAFWGGTFRISGGNITAALGKPQVNLYNTLFTGFLNIIFDVFLISHFGSAGAAASTSLIYMLSGSISAWYLCTYLKKKIKN